MDGPPDFTYMEPEAAIRLIRRTRRKRFFMHFNLDAAPVGREETHTYQDRQHISLSAEQAVEILRNLAHTSELRSGMGKSALRVRVHEMDNLISFG